MRRFRSGTTGEWHDTPYVAAGEDGFVDAVELNGERIFRNDGETPLAWLHRVYEWVKEINHRKATVAAVICNKCGTPSYEDPPLVCFNCQTMKYNKI